MTVLIVDNHDSYTWNLAHQVARITGVLPEVHANDALTRAQVDALDPAALILSPGPGRPGVARDLGVGADLLRARPDLPTLGVCLGHQALGWVHGAHIARAPEPVHGHVHPVHHDGTGLFAGLPSPLPVVRYHSLHLRDLPPTLVPCAWADDGVVQALREVDGPRHGVQFHPESIGTRHGDDLLAAFLDGAGVHRGPVPMPAPRPRRADRARVHVRQLQGAADAEAVFVHLVAGRHGAVWLDSAGRQGASPSRFSYVGAADGPLGRVLTWRRDEPVHLQRPHEAPRPVDTDLETTLRDALAEAATTRDDLPFDFLGGWVGWLGYGCKARWLAPDQAPAPGPDAPPDVAMAFVDRLVVVDHEADTTWLVALAHRGGGDAARAWFATMTSALATLPTPPPPRPVPAGPLRPTVPRQAYLDAIEDARRAILDGESYEVCLTQPLRAGPLARPLDTYRVLRRLNPAPYAAFVDLAGTAVLCASPEQFLRVDRHGTASARPIKGTTARHADPARDADAAHALACSVKDRAENLMIVDLLRHDLGRVGQPASVEVPSLMAVERFATVHHLVSTITTRLAPDRDALDAIAAAFPPGSMTGAPKERTVEILDALEPHPRGVYSGALGWLGVDGAADLAVVIRTAVATASATTAGVGGAITWLSSPAAEWDEALLKGAATGRALLEGAPDDDGPRPAPTSAAPRQR